MQQDRCLLPFNFHCLNMLNSQVESSPVLVTQPVANVESRVLGESHR